MALTVDVLASGLGKLNGTDEKTAIETFSTAWLDYFSKGTINGISANSATLEAAKTALKGGLIGMTKASGGSLAIQKGITAFWGVIVASAVTVWITAPNIITLVTPPTTLSGIKVAIDTAAAANISGKVKKDLSFKSIAAAIHTTGGLGSVVALQAPNGAVLPPSTIL
jgi:hypothetical protein